MAPMNEKRERNAFQYARGYRRSKRWPPLAMRWFMYRLPKKMAARYTAQIKKGVYGWSRVQRTPASDS